MGHLIVDKQTCSRWPTRGVRSHGWWFGWFHCYASRAHAPDSRTAERETVTSLLIFTHSPDAHRCNWSCTEKQEPQDALRYPQRILRAAKSEAFLQAQLGGATATAESLPKMIKLRPYVPSKRIAIRDSSIDEDASDDVEDEVFIKDARSAKVRPKSKIIRS